ncbi:hypothetical protein FA95DRAFT_948563 [Auriscalpium vulgare]|uniref:Uncharacterized protein n=1 Tax=Auriscalpium vulgare TaxID=40419 RepID=A0ACB8RY64_9AGAM|nr:hypothetical protein FA95DRAFT_948563 [Auriscalpium vulgare]
MKNALLLLRMRRNHIVAPIMRVPPEILEEIFSFTQAAYPMKRREGRGCEVDLGWMKISHVCRSWRETALGISALWRELDFDITPQLWADEILRRSANAPLLVRAAVPVLEKAKTKDGASYCLNASNVVRLQALTLNEHSTVRCVGEIADHAVLQKIIPCDTPAPALETLTLTHSGAGNYRVPARIFRGHTPRLRTLHLVGFVPHWTVHAHLFANLTELRLTPRSMVHDDDLHHIPTARALAGMLRAMRALQVLALGSGALDSFLDEEEEAAQAVHGPIPRIELPALRTLELYQGQDHDNMNWYDFVGLFCMPPSVKVRVALGQVSHGPDYNSLRPVLQVLGGAHTAPHALEVHFHGDEHFDFAKLALKCDRASDAGHSLSFMTPKVFRPELALFDEPWDALEMGNLTEVHVSLVQDAYWSAGMWQQAFGRARGVEHLQLSGAGGLAGLFDAMTSVSEGENRPLFPELKVLQLHDWMTGCVATNEALLEAHGRCLQARRAVGKGNLDVAMSCSPTGVVE